jgi:predicted transcriptional regulator
MENLNQENRPKKRSRTDVIFDILRILQENRGRIKPTHLLYKANLSHETMRMYLGNLKKNGLLKEIELELKKAKSKKLIAITPKGIDFYIKYSKMKEFERTFGI